MSRANSRSASAIADQTKATHSASVSGSGVTGDRIAWTHSAASESNFGSGSVGTIDVDGSANDSGGAISGTVGCVGSSGASGL